MTLQLVTLQLDNQSPWQAGLYPGWSAERLHRGR